MQVYIINLDQSTDRLARQQKQFARLGLSFDRLPAVSVADISQEFYINHVKHGQRLMKQTEMACFLSHKKAWQQVISHDSPCVILEDDAVLAYDFAQVLADIDRQNLGGQVDLINLEVQPRKKVVSHQPIATILGSEYELYQLLLEKNGTGGYILYPSGAKKLMDKAQRTIALADAFIYHCHGLHTTQIEPAVLLQDVICPAYDVPIEAPPHSIIGAVQNTVDFTPTLWHKLHFKKNRILTQLMLGFKTLWALSKGVKRQISVRREKFLDNH